MAKLRPARCYRVKKRPWTRQSRRKPKKGYVRGVPNLKIRRFRTGRRADYDATFFIVGKDDLQVRENAMEAARIAMTNYLQKNIKANFYLIIRKYPFQVMREHKQAAVAGADRFFSGMRHAFGKPAGSCVQMSPGDVLFELRANKKDFSHIKEAFRRANMKLPGGFELIESTEEIKD